MPEDFDSILQTGSARFAETTRPPTAATLRGRAQRRRRQRVAGATAAVGVLGVAAVVAAMLGSGSGLRATPTPPATSATPATTPSGPPPVFTVGSDPVEQHAAFGWLPTWVTGVSYQSGAGDTEAAAATGQTGTTPGPMWLTVSKQDPAAAIHSGGGKTEKVSAPTVNGSPAFWTWTPIEGETAPSPGTVPSRAALEWQVGGAWVNLSGDTLGIGTLTAQQKSEQIRIAAGVTVGDQPLPLPVHVQGFPAGLPTAGGNMLHGSWAHNGAKWSLDLTFMFGPGPNQTTNLNIRVGPKGTVTPDPRSVCKTERELQVCTEFTGPEPAALAASGGVQGLLDHITLLGPDPQYWTVHVID